MDSLFDPTAFLDATTTEANSRRSPLPVGRDYQGIINDINIRQANGRKDPTAVYTFLDAKIDIQIPPDLLQSVGQPIVQLTDGVMLDVSPAGGLDMSPGKNGKLRRYREALGLNTPGQPFSPRMMVGRTLTVRVKHDTYEGEIFDRVDSIAKG